MQGDASSRSTKDQPRRTVVGISGIVKAGGCPSAVQVAIMLVGNGQSAATSYS